MYQFHSLKQQQVFLLKLQTEMGKIYWRCILANHVHLRGFLYFQSQLECEDIIEGEELNTVRVVKHIKRNY